jgi:hypothetical protein
MNIEKNSKDNFSNSYNELVNTSGDISLFFLSYSKRITLEILT